MEAALPPQEEVAEPAGQENVESGADGQHDGQQPEEAQAGEVGGGEDAHGAAVGGGEDESTEDAEKNILT